MAACNPNYGLWVFGYGSLCWNPGFEFEKSCIGYIRGYTRRFSQGNTYHRGTQEKPGRVATLIEDTDRFYNYPAPDPFARPANVRWRSRSWEMFDFRIVIFPAAKKSNTMQAGRTERAQDNCEIADSVLLHLHRTYSQGIVWGRAFLICGESALQYLAERECKLGGYKTVFAPVYTVSGNNSALESAPLQVDDASSACEVSTSIHHDLVDDIAGRVQQVSLRDGRNRKSRMCSRHRISGSVSRISESSYTTDEENAGYHDAPSSPAHDNETQTEPSVANSVFSFANSICNNNNSIWPSVNNSSRSNNVETNRPSIDSDENENYFDCDLHSTEDLVFTSLGPVEPVFDPPAWQPYRQVAQAAIVYIATDDNEHWLGDAKISQLAYDICNTSGKTGHNIDYVLNLAKFVRENCPYKADGHLFELETEILRQKPEHKCDFYEKLQLETKQSSVRTEGVAQQPDVEHNHQPYRYLEFSKRVPSKKLRCLNI